MYLHVCTRRCVCMCRCVYVCMCMCIYTYVCVSVAICLEAFTRAQASREPVPENQSPSSRAMYRARTASYEIVEGPTDVEMAQATEQVARDRSEAAEHVTREPAQSVQAKPASLEDVVYLLEHMSKAIKAIEQNEDISSTKLTNIERRQSELEGELCKRPKLLAWSKMFQK